MKHLTTLVAICIATLANAQDLIVLKNGDIIHSKVQEIGLDQIKYKKWSNQEGPDYVIAKSEVLSINYQNGEKDTFNSIENSSNLNISSEAPKEQSLVPLGPDERNKDLLSEHNEPITFHKVRIGGRPSDYLMYHLAVAPNSILSNKHCEVFFEFKECWHSGYHSSYDDSWIWGVKNKTDKVIYVDLTKTYSTDNFGESRIYYNDTQVSVMSTSGGANSQNIGIGVFGASRTNASGGGSLTSYSNPKILVIPPHGKVYVAEFKEVCTDEGQSGTLLLDIGYRPATYQTISEGENFYSGNKLKKLSLIKIGKKEVKFYTPANTPYFKRYTITYSFNEDFASYSELRFKLYVKEAYGAPHVKSRHIKKNLKQIIVGGFSGNGIY